MKLLVCLLPLSFVEIAYCQVIPHAPNSGIISQNIAATQPHGVLATGPPLGAARPLGGLVANVPIAGSGPNFLANAQIANAINENAIVAANQDIAIANANLANANMAALANANLASINGNTATFNIGNAFSITSGSPGAQRFGIQVLADALEVGGTVAVNGQIPIFGTVAVNGHLPTDGSATVNFNCVRPVID